MQIKTISGNKNKCLLESENLVDSECLKQTSKQKGTDHLITGKPYNFLCKRQKEPALSITEIKHRSRRCIRLWFDLKPELFAAQIYVRLGISTSTLNRA